MRESPLFCLVKARVLDLSMEPAIERVIDFVVKFTTLQSSKSSIDEEFVQALCLRLLGLVDLMDKGVRWRVARGGTESAARQWFDRGQSSGFSCRPRPRPGSPYATRQRL